MEDSSKIENTNSEEITTENTIEPTDVTIDETAVTENLDQANPSATETLNDEEIVEVAEEEMDQISISLNKRQLKKLKKIGKKIKAKAKKAKKKNLEKIKKAKKKKKARAKKEKIRSKLKEKKAKKKANKKKKK
jgi:hypothetical protein